MQPFDGFIGLGVLKDASEKKCKSLYHTFICCFQPPQRSPAPTLTAKLGIVVEARLDPWVAVNLTRVWMELLSAVFVKN